MSDRTPRADRNDKNLIINGGMDFFQRSNPAVGEAMTGSGTLEYIAPDRFRVASDGAADNGTVKRNTSSPDSKTKHSLQMTLDADNSTDELIFEQRIEAANIREFVNLKFNLGFQVNSDSATQIELELFTADVEDDFSAQTSFHTETFDITTGSWQAVNFEGITLPSGSERGIAVRVTLTTMSVTGSSENHFITQMNANIGKRGSSSFTLSGRNIAEEFAFCQRYFETSYDLDVEPQTTTSVGSVTGIGNSTSQIICAMRWVVEKRKIPSMTVYSRTGVLNFVTIIETFTEIDVNGYNGQGINGPYIVNDGTIGVIQGEGYQWHYLADAEL